MTRLLLGLALAAAGCKSSGGGGGALSDAAPRPDAAEISCDEVDPVELDLGPAIAAGASDDLYRIGGGAWVAHAGVSGPPGDLFYLEAYRDLFAGMTVEVSSFKNWQIECEVCVFLGRGCPAFEIRVDGDGDPVAPVDCDALFMLDRGRVELQAFDVDPVVGALAGAVAPRDGDAELRFVEVGRAGNPGTPGGFGERLEGGRCVGAGAIAFSGAWDNAPDAGPGDADVRDAGADDPTPP